MGFIEKNFKQDILRSTSREELFAKHKINFEIMRRRASMIKWSKPLLYSGLVIFIASHLRSAFFPNFRMGLHLGNDDLLFYGIALMLVLVFLGIFLRMYGFFWNEMYKIFGGEEHEKDSMFHDG